MDVPDLRPWLDAWPHDPDETFRVVRLDDGREVLQVRRPLGFEQYELSGRPDGRRPEGRESWLHTYEERRRSAEMANLPFQLSAEDCERLHEEGVLYYYRYVMLFQMEDYARVVRDTERNLRMFDMIRDCVADRDEQIITEQYRPYVVRMNAMARAMVYSAAGDLDLAIEAIDRAIEAIEELPPIDLETFEMEQRRSVALLQGAAEELRQNRPLSRLERLEKDLEEAIRSERYEDAASLRDRIRDERKPSPRD